MDNSLGDFTYVCFAGVGVVICMALLAFVIEFLDERFP
jgi:hypothetical protein